jgi:hypothetical protein
MTLAQKGWYAMKCGVVLMLVVLIQAHSSPVLTQMRSANGFPRVTILRLLPSWFPGCSMLCCLLNCLAPSYCPLVIEPSSFGRFRRNLGGKRVVFCMARRCWLLGRVQGHCSLLWWWRRLRSSWFLLLACPKGGMRTRKTHSDPMAP